MSAPLFPWFMQMLCFGIWNIWEAAPDYGTASNLVIFRLISNCNKDHQSGNIPQCLAGK